MYTYSDLGRGNATLGIITPHPTIYIIYEQTNSGRISSGGKREKKIPPLQNELSSSRILIFFGPWKIPHVYPALWLDRTRFRIDRRGADDGGRRRGPLLDWWRILEKGGRNEGTEGEMDGWLFILIWIRYHTWNGTKLTSSPFFFYTFFCILKKKISSKIRNPFFTP